MDPTGKAPTYGTWRYWALRKPISDVNCLIRPTVFERYICKKNQDLFFYTYILVAKEVYVLRVIFKNDIFPHNGFK